MSNLQVACVDACRRSRNVPSTYGQRMPAYAKCESYAGICRQISNMLKIGRRTRRTTAFNNVLRGIPACFSVLLTYTKLIDNVLYVCQRFRQIVFIRLHTLAKTAMCDSGLNRRATVF